MGFEVVGEITDVEIIAVGSGVRIASQLRKRYGKGRWRKLKGKARVRLAEGMVRFAEVHCSKHTASGRRRCGSSDSLIDDDGQTPSPAAPLRHLHSLG
jgi:hypothetical protein